MIDICPICGRPVEKTWDLLRYTVPHSEGLFSCSAHITCLKSALEWIGQMMRVFRLTPGKLTIASEGDLSISAGPIPVLDVELKKEEKPCCDQTPTTPTPNR